MSDNDYTLNDVKQAAQRIVDACPDVILDRSGDYGFKLVGYKRGPRDVRILFQPHRPENGQEFIRADIDEAIRSWGGTP